MSDIPVTPTPEVVSGEGIAERYVERELEASRAALVRTQIIGGALALFVLGYMGYLTTGFRNSLEPAGAAEIATGLASQRLDDVEPRFAEYIHEQVPMMIRKAPDEIIARMPEYRKSLEDRVEADLRAQAKAGADQLSQDLDTFLTAHKDEVAALIKDGQDPQATEAMGDQLEAQFRDFLHEVKIGGTSIDEKLAATLSTLRQVRARTERLAANKNLTPAEKSARKAIAALMHRIETAQANSGPLPTINHAAVKEAVENVSASVRQP